MNYTYEKKVETLVSYFKSVKRSLILSLALNWNIFCWRRIAMGCTYSIVN